MSSQSTKKRVFVGLSGGVDSAVSLALLQKAGYDVSAVFIKVWQPDWIECSSNEDRREAMRVAASLNVPFYTLDLEQQYKQGVIDYMIAEYKAGRTPNPDVMCNREVKFGAFAKWAKEQGADYIATGHYARVQNDMGKTKLLMGKDANKDQSYFLWTLNQKDLPSVLFPVGGLEKPAVRKLARKFRLPNAGRKDSQGLCFIGKVDIKEFLTHYIDVKPGNVLNTSGEVIGTHPGALFFTIGQRHGFSINKKAENDSPLYVVQKDMEKNTLTVSDKEKGLLFGAEKIVSIRSLNWVKGEAPAVEMKGKFQLQARIRYRQHIQNIKINSMDIDHAVIEFEKLQDTITPGQSLVIYDGEECLGGGIID